MKLIRWLTMAVLVGSVLLGTGTFIGTTHATPSGEVTVLVLAPYFMEGNFGEYSADIDFYDILEAAKTSKALGNIKWLKKRGQDITSYMNFLFEDLDGERTIDVALVHEQFLPQVVHSGYCQALNELEAKIKKAKVRYISIGETIYALESVIPKWWVIIPKKESIKPEAFDVAIKLANRERQITITLSDFEILTSGGEVLAPANEIQIWIELKACSLLENTPDIFDQHGDLFPNKFEKSVMRIIPSDGGYIEVDKGEKVDKVLGHPIEFTFNERGLHRYFLTILVWDIDDIPILEKIKEFIKSPVGTAETLYVSFITGGLPGFAIGVGLKVFEVITSENDLKGTELVPLIYLFTKDIELEDQDLALGGEKILPGLKKFKIPDEGTDYKAKLHIEAKEMWEL